jgi:hypothetical protein
MRSFSAIGVTTALALSFAAAAETRGGPTSGAADRVGHAFLERLADEFLERPDASNAKPHRDIWTSSITPVTLPPDLLKGPLDHQSIVILDVDAAGKAAGCRPLRESSDKRLDDLACKLLMWPGRFSAKAIPSARPVAPRWVMRARFQTLDQATYRAQVEEAMRPFKEPPAPAAKPAPRPPAPPPSTGPRKVLSGLILATHYLGIADTTTKNDDFHARLDVGPDGVPTGCKVTRSSGNEAVDARTCELLVEHVRYSLRVDSSGKLIADTVDETIPLDAILGDQPR